MASPVAIPVAGPTPWRRVSALLRAAIYRDFVLTLGTFIFEKELSLVAGISLAIHQ